MLAAQMTTDYNESMVTTLDEELVALGLDPETVKDNYTNGACWSLAIALHVVAHTISMSSIASN